MDVIHGRRKLKRGYEYEVQWKGQPLDKNEWLTRDTLEEMGFQKMLNEIDIKEAAKMGLVQRPLTGLSPFDLISYNSVYTLSGHSLGTKHQALLSKSKQI